MTLIDSRAVFSKRLQDLSLGDLSAAFEAYGWVTFGSFAFATTPGASDAVLTEGVLKKLTVDEALWPSIRRLHFEAYTITMGDLKGRANQTESESVSRTMPPPEKADRFGALKKAYPSIVFDEMMEPSDSLVDKFHTMQDKGVLKYLPWNEYGRRDMELEGVQQDICFKPDKNGHLKAAMEPAAAPDADIGSVYKLEKAFYRRGAAMHMATLMTFSVHEELMKYYLREHGRDPLPGYAPISLEQIQRTDREIFRRMAEETRSGLGLTIGDYQIGKIIQQRKVDCCYALQAFFGGGGFPGGTSPCLP